ncbi:MAG: hypothetical protein LBI84_09945 [Propionibacteriaceae bacterium]|nr:hypothetical protein [Propionibacteriaceae bacterium]
MSKAELTRQLLSLGLIGVPTIVLDRSTQWEGHLESFLGSSPVAILRASSSSQLRNLPYGTALSLIQARGFVDGLPAHCDAVVVQAYEQPEFSVEVSASEDTAYLEICPGTRVFGAAGTIYACCARLADLARPSVAGVAFRRLSVPWSSAVGFVTRLDGTRETTPPLDEVPLGPLRRLLMRSVLPMRTLTGSQSVRFYAHYSRPFGWSVQNTREPQDARALVDALTRHRTRDVDVRRVAATDVNEFQQFVVPIVGPVGSRHTTQAAAELLRRLHDLGYRRVAVEAGILSHEAILARGLGLQVVL